MLTMILRPNSLVVELTVGYMPLIFRCLVILLHSKISLAFKVLRNRLDSRFCESREEHE